MTKPDDLAVLRAALQMCDENNGAASVEAIAARLGVDTKVAQLELLPPIAKYFEKVLQGGDGVVVVRQPTGAARQFAQA